MINTYVFDWKRTLYNPESKTLIEGAEDIIRFAHNQGAKVILVGKGDHAMFDEVNRLGISKYFDHIQFNEGPKDSSQFAVFIDPKNRRDTLVVGDRVKSELSIGNMLGATTVWVRQGKFSDEEPAEKIEEPTYTVSSLQELLGMISSGLIR